jgi:glycosyltransferase involved in cell wall biosynthesis
MSGGGSVLSSEIVDSFSKQGHNVSVIVPDVEWDDSKFEPSIDPKIKIIRVKTPSKNNIKVAARLCKKNLEKEINEICNKEKFDFILTIFHPFHRVPHAAISAAKKQKIPVIVKIDDPIYAKTSGLKSLQRSLEKISNGKALRNADKILVVNESIKQLIIKKYNIDEKKIVIIPNGINTKLFKNKINHEFLTIIFSGVMYYHRGVDVLLESLSKIVKKFPDSKTILLGSGPELENLKKITNEKNLLKFVDFKGWVDREDIPNYLANSDVGIGPLNLTEVTANALPIKVLEYMAASLPIIAKTGTLPESILIDKKNGFLIKNSTDLAEKLEILLSDSDLQRKMGEESLKMVKKFDWEKITSMILEQYKKIK